MGDWQEGIFTLMVYVSLFITLFGLVFVVSVTIITPTWTESTNPSPVAEQVDQREVTITEYKYEYPSTFDRFLYGLGWFALIILANAVAWTGLMFGIKWYNNRQWERMDRE